MTPVPSSPVALLDQLDELRASATPGPWVQCRPFTKLIDAPDSECMATADNPADAALIVAAVNALPEMIAELRKRDAAVRAVLELHAPLDRGTGPQCQGCATHATFTRWPCPTVAALSVTP